MASFWQFCWHTDDILTFGPTPFLRIQSWDKKIRIQYFCLQTKKHSLVFIEVQKWKTVVSLFAFWQLPLRSPWVWFCYKNQSDCFISVKLVHYIDFPLKNDNLVGDVFQEPECDAVGGTCTLVTDCTSGTPISGKCPQQASTVKCCLPCKLNQLRIGGLDGYADHTFVNVTIPR